MDPLYINSRIRVKPDSITYIKRSLSYTKGKVNVSVGQEVCPEDVLAEEPAPTGFRTVYLAKELQVNPKHASGCLKRQLGQTIFTGELLAEKTALFGLQKKVVLAPVDGIVDYYDEEKGTLKIKLLPGRNQLVSGAYGVIEQIIATSGSIVIRTCASLVYGVIGSGRERGGLLRIIGGADTLVSSRQIVEGYRGEIVVGGSLTFMDALEKAASIKVSGIVTGGINAGDFKTMVGGNWNPLKKHWSDVGLTLMATEGFGSIPTGEDIFNLLRQHQGQFALLDGNLRRLVLPSDNPDSMIYVRRTKLPKISLVEPEVEIQATPLAVGGRVRIVAPPLLGKQGVVESVDRTVSRLPSGVFTYLVTVVSKNQKLRVPYINLEAIN